MHILIVGQEQNLEECRQKFGLAHSYARISNGLALTEAIEDSDVVFDFMVDQVPTRNIAIPYFIDATQTSIAKYRTKGGQAIRYLFGFPGLPSFLNREILEATCEQDQSEKLGETCRELKTEYQVVADRVGLVTPRVICMIINEAYYTLQDGIAARSDIDLAMKLGTNYPMGPFEWCREIGIQNVCRLLEAVHADTGDNRYRVSPLLKAESLEN